MNYLVADFHLFLLLVQEACLGLLARSRVLEALLVLVEVDVLLCAVFLLQADFEVTTRLVVVGLAGRHDLLGGLHVTLAQDRDVCWRVHLLSAMRSW